jgi:PAS domain S-box-containing protein
MPDSAVKFTDADAKVLLEVLARVNDGDFTARMPVEWTGLPGKIADSLNEVVIAAALPRDGADVGESCERFEITDGDEGRVVLATSERILEPNGEIGGWIGTLADVTAASRERAADAARRGAEDRYRHIVETTMEGVWLVDSQNHTTFVNEAMAGMLETTVADMAGRSLFEFVDADRSDAAEGSGSLLRGMGESEQFEMTLRTRSGSELHVLVSTNPLHDEAGNYVGALAMVRDVTERVEQAALRDVLEEQLRQSQRLESIGQLAGGIAHDFNNLLLAIRGFGELALGRLGRHDDDAAEYVRDILEAADRATLLTKQLLAFGRRQVLQPEVIDLRDVVASVERLLGPLLGEDVELAIVSPEAPVLVVADRTQVEQVIANLAVNARDAIPAGGSIRVELSSTTEPTPEAVLAITDDGCGMDAETIARIFEPFFSTKGAAGTGLGLATVHGIVNQSGGRIGLESRVGLGSTFSIFLPLSTGAVAPSPPPASKSGGGADTILVVEDDPMVRSLVTKILVDLGYRVLTAAGGQAALELTDAWPAEIDLILTDLVMPGLSGRETAMRVRGRFPAARVLYMSGYTDDIVIRGGAFEPGTAFVQKPFGSDELARSVREALDLELELVG